MPATSGKGGSAAPSNGAVGSNGSVGNGNVPEVKIGPYDQSYYTTGVMPNPRTMLAQNGQPYWSEEYNGSGPVTLGQGKGGQFEQMIQGMSPENKAMMGIVGQMFGIGDMTNLHPVVSALSQIGSGIRSYNARAFTPNGQGEFANAPTGGKGGSSPAPASTTNTPTTPSTTPAPPNPNNYGTTDLKVPYETSSNGGKGGTRMGTATAPTSVDQKAGINAKPYKAPSSGGLFGGGGFGGGGIFG